MTPEEKRTRKAAMERARRAADPEKIRAQERARRAADPEKSRAYQRARRAADPEKRKAYQRALYAADPEKIRAQARARRAADPEKRRAQQRAQYARQKHPAMVYYLLDACGLVKIGKTTNIWHRLVVFRTGTPYTLTWIAFEWGGRALEKKRHRQFEHLRERGEWFRLGPDLIAQLVQGMTDDDRAMMASLQEG